ncbi:hypothetical protein RHS04_08641 [Rhizoctonia solani]|uniref:Uncharacterized protein n=1 Tax=Rhizoctonia solani TaxID=456999 RepID=A0A8H7H061_9AGAM|nr:hypothetical protein RHS04_08641 [Rhizoctonia solani]
MATVLHSWLNEAQESSRYDSVAAKYGLVVDTPSGMSQTGQNALRFLRSLSEHSPTFFEDQARLLSPPTPGLLASSPIPTTTSPPSSALATPVVPMSGPQRVQPRRQPSASSRAHLRDFDEALFSLDMPPTDDPLFVPNPNHHNHHHRHHQQRARPYPALPRIHPHPDLAPLGGSYFPPPPDPSPGLGLGLSPWDKHPAHYYQGYASPPLAFSSPQTPDAAFAYTPIHPQSQSPFVASPQPESEPESSEMEIHSLGGDEDRARMSALMYGSMRARAVVAANETDTQGW